MVNPDNVVIPKGCDGAGRGVGKVYGCLRPHNLGHWKRKTATSHRQTAPFTLFFSEFGEEKAQLISVNAETS